MNSAYERSSRRVFLKRAAGLTAGAALVAQAPGLVESQTETVFGIVGDYGSDSSAERRVSNLIKSWNPAFVGTTGDNVYSGAAAQSYEVLQRKVGNYYGQFINDQTFYPALGNHDWGHPGVPLLSCDMNDCWGAWKDFFTLPGNGRYYDVRKGDVHLFVVDDYYLEPDGNKVDSKQAQWLKRTAAASNAPWKIVVHHFSAYGSYGQFKTIRWPFEQWGIDAVLSGHHHVYERLKIGGIPYITTGTGGSSLSGTSGWRHPDQKAVHVKRYGAVRGRATTTRLTFEMITVDGVVLDRVDVDKGVNPAPAPAPAPDPEPVGDDIPTVNPKGPATIITAPTTNQATGRTPLIEGWATAGKGVSHVDLVIRNTGTRQYWNDSTGKMQNSWVTNRVPVQTVGARVTVWNYRNSRGSLPVGSYQARAWTKAVNGHGDPFGNAIVQFMAR